MTRSRLGRAWRPAVAGVAVVVGAVLLTGCGQRLVDLPVQRTPAVPVPLAQGAPRCTAGSVAFGDDEPESGAGSVPADFTARTVLRCEVDTMNARLRAGTETLRVRQYEAPVTPELRAALDLPDRELRPRGACAASMAGFTAVYLVDEQRRAVRVLLPTDDPCSQIRAEVAARLPANNGTPALTFSAKRPAR